MKISKFFCMLIAGLAIIGFTTIGHATEAEEIKSESESEAIGEVESAAKVESEAESKEEIQYGGEPKVKSEEKE